MLLKRVAVTRYFVISNVTLSCNISAFCVTGLYEIPVVQLVWMRFEICICHLNFSISWMRTSPKLQCPILLRKSLVHDADVNAFTCTMRKPSVITAAVSRQTLCTERLTSFNSASLPAKFNVRWGSVSIYAKHCAEGEADVYVSRHDKNQFLYWGCCLALIPRHTEHIALLLSTLIKITMGMCVAYPVIVKVLHDDVINVTAHA